MTMTTQDLQSVVAFMLLAEAKRLGELDARTYSLDVVDGAEYAQHLSAADERRRKARFAEQSMVFTITHAEDEQRVAAHVARLAERLRGNYLAKANAFLKAAAYRADKRTRSELAAVLKEHGASDDAKLFSYLTLLELIKEQEECEEPQAGSEDRFRDEVALAYEGCDSPEQLGALLKNVQLPTEKEIGRARARAYAA